MRHIDLDQLAEDYRSGLSRNDLARKHRISFQCIDRRLRNVGITPKPRLKGGPERTKLPTGQIKRMFLSGWSVKALAERFQTSRAVVINRLKKMHIPTRGRSASMRIRMGRATRKERSALTKAAHDATRGKPRSRNSLRKASVSREMHPHPAHMGKREAILSMMLADRGINAVPQKSIGIYNCDLAAAPVAVEVWEGHWHYMGSHAARTPDRLREMMRLGWNVLVIHLDATTPLREATADHVVAYIKQCRRHPPVIREYRVIDGTGNVFARGNFKTDSIAIKPPNGRSKNPDSENRHVPK